MKGTGEDNHSSRMHESLRSLTQGGEGLGQVTAVGEEAQDAPMHTQSPSHVQGTWVWPAANLLPCFAWWIQTIHPLDKTRPFPWPGSVNEASVSSPNLTTSGPQASGTAENGLPTSWVPQTHSLFKAP